MKLVFLRFDKQSLIFYASLSICSSCLLHVNLTVVHVFCVRMDDDGDSCVMKYIEIVPLDNFELCPDSTDVKFDPSHVKVRVCFFDLCRFCYF